MVILKNHLCEQYTVRNNLENIYVPFSEDVNTLPDSYFEKLAD